MDGSDTAMWLQRTAREIPERPTGEVVREYRIASGLNQTSLARMMGITQQFLSLIETGVRTVPLELRQEFARALGIPPEELGLAPRGRRGLAPSADTAAVAASRGRWRAQRHWLNRHRGELGAVAAQQYPADNRLARTSLIVGDGWVPDAPVDLESTRLRLREDAQAVAVTGGEAETLAVRPLRTRDEPFERYSIAVKHLDPPQLFESRPSYRYLGGSIERGDMDFGLAAYFDKLDVCEALAHELAIASMEGPSADDLRGVLPFRELVGDPFDLSRRAVIPAITTLTIRLRRFPAAPTFLLHWRDPSRVATAGGVYDVIPAGEFQPSSVALWDRSNDFSLWRNMVREYSEELLGHPEHDGTRSAAIDYDEWPLYQQLGAARRRGRVRAHLLGVGLDALTLAATILTVVVIDDDVFDEIFGAAVQFNEEGEVVGVSEGRATDGVPFTAETIDRLLTTEPLAAPGAACLALAWQHRQRLLC